MPVVTFRGDDGINRSIELELGECDICHKVVLQTPESGVPPPFTERQWPEVQERLRQLFDASEVPAEKLWDR